MKCDTYITYITGTHHWYTEIVKTKTVYKTLKHTIINGNY